jgi:hypothetical protein
MLSYPRETPRFGSLELIFDHVAGQHGSSPP